MSCQRRVEEEEEDEEEGKESKRSSGEGENIGGEVRQRRRNHEEEITLEDGSIVFERITPTQAFSVQREEELNGWSGGGEEMK